MGAQQVRAKDFVELKCQPASNVSKSLNQILGKED